MFRKVAPTKIPTKTSTKTATKNKIFLKPPSKKNNDMLRQAPSEEYKDNSEEYKDESEAYNDEYDDDTISEIDPDSQPWNELIPLCATFYDEMQKNKVDFTLGKINPNTGIARSILSGLMNLPMLVAEAERDGSSSNSTVTTSFTQTTISNPQQNENAEIMLTTDLPITDTLNPLLGIDERIQFLKSVNIGSTGGKRKRRYALKNNRTMKRGKLIKGGNISDWLCHHADFAAGAILLSFIGGAFWCLGSYIIPVAMKELRGAVWNYIVKVCETTAVVITNLFKTSGGVSKFIDLIVNSYMGLAVTKQAGIDAYDKLIRPPFCQIRDMLIAACCTDEATKKAAIASLTTSAPVAGPSPPAPGAGPSPPGAESSTHVFTAPSAAPSAAPSGRIELSEPDRKLIENLVSNVSVAINLAGGDNGDNIEEQLAALTGAISQESVLLSTDEAVEVIDRIIVGGAVEVLAEIDGYNKNEEDMIVGGNIISYLAKKIKKTMKRRKRSHKKYAKKNINYKSHKKNKR